MNWKQIESKWDELKGDVKVEWGKLTDDDMHVLAGKRDVLVGKISERYGILKEEAENQVDSWTAKLTKSNDAARAKLAAKSPLASSMKH